MRRLFINLLIFFLILFLSAALGIYIYLKTQSKRLFETQLSKLLKEKVKIEKAEYKFPGIFLLKNIKSETVKIKKADLDLDLLKLLFRKIVFSLNLEEATFNFKSNLKIQRKSTRKILRKKRRVFKIIIQNLDLKKANLTYTYFKLKPPIIIKLKDLNLRIRNLSLPELDTPLEFNVYSTVLWKDSQGNFKAFGSLNYKRKDLDARLIFKDIELTYFYDYFPKVSKPFFKDLKYCFLDLKSDLNSKNDKLLIEGSIFLKRFKFKRGASDTNVRLFKRILKFFITPEDQCRFDFKFETQLSNPKINFIFLKKQFEAKLKHYSQGFVEKAVNTITDTLTQTVEGTVKGTTQVPKKGLKILKDILEEIFQ